MWRYEEPFLPRFHPLALEVGQNLILFETKVSTEAVKRNDSTLDHPVNRNLGNPEQIRNLVDCHQPNRHFGWQLAGIMIPFK